MAIDKLIDSGIIIMDNSEDELLAAVKRSEKELYKEIVKVFENVDITDGKLKSTEKAEQFLLSLDKKIRDAAKKSGYNKSVGRFTSDFNKIADNVKKIQSELNSINITAAQIAPIQNIEVVNTLGVLLGDKFDASIIKPLQQAIYRNIMSGSTIAETEDYLKKFLVSNPDSDSRLLRYVKQVSRDSISQFDGALQTNIASELGLDAIRYVGSLLQDSRAQCKKWVGEGLIKLDSAFESEINSAVNGTLYFQGKKSSGMYADTNLSNIAIYKGGYSCRHRAFPTKWIKPKLP